MDTIKTILHGMFFERSAGGLKYSLGRTLLIILFISAMIMWFSGREIPQTMLTVLLTFVGYTFGTKAVNVIEKIKGSQNASNN